MSYDEDFNTPEYISLDKLDLLFDNGAYVYVSYDDKRTCSVLVRYPVYTMYRTCQWHDKGLSHIPADHSHVPRDDQYDDLFDEM